MDTTALGLQGRENLQLQVVFGSFGFSNCRWRTSLTGLYQLEWSGTVVSYCVLLYLGMVSSSPFRKRTQDFLQLPSPKSLQKGLYFIYFGCSLGPKSLAEASELQQIPQPAVLAMALRRFNAGGKKQKELTEEQGSEEVRESG